MSRDIPSDLAGDILTGTRPWAFALRVVTRETTPVTYAYTSATRDKTIDGVLYKSVTGPVVQSFRTMSGLGVGNNVLRVLQSEDEMTRVRVLEGRFDGAGYWIFLFNWRDPEKGIIEISKGTLGNITPLPGGAFDVELRDLKEPLQHDRTQVHQPTCRVEFCSEFCTLDESDFTFSVTVGAVAGDRSFTDATLTSHPDDHFSEGKIIWLTGVNTGRVDKIRAFDNLDGLVELDGAPPRGIDEGDTGDIVVGCRHRPWEDCRDRFDNLLNFQGEPDYQAVTTDAAVGQPNSPPTEVPGSTPAPSPGLPTPPPPPAPSPVPAPSPAPAPAAGERTHSCVIGWKLARPGSVGAATTLGTLHGKRSLVFGSFYVGLGGSKAEAQARWAAYVTAAKAARATKVINYEIFSELRDGDPNTAYAAFINTARSDGKGGAWMYNSAGQRGAEFGFGGGVYQYEINGTDAVPTLGGKRPADWHAEQAVDYWGDDADGYVEDNVFDLARGWSQGPTWTYDPDRDGDNDAISSDRLATIHVEHRQGKAYYQSRLRALHSGCEVWANSTPHTLAATEYEGQYDGGMIEDADNKLTDAGRGFAWLMDVYAGTEQNTIQGKVIIECRTAGVQLPLWRFFAGFAAMRNGGYVSVQDSGTQVSSEFDELEVVIGAPVDAVQTAAAINGCWARAFDDAMWIINPTTATQTITKTWLDTKGSWKRFDATDYSSQDTAFNTGSAVSASFTLAAKAGILLVRA